MSKQRYTSGPCSMMRYPVLRKGKVVCSFRDQGSASTVAYQLNIAYNEGRKSAKKKTKVRKRRWKDI